MPDWIYMLPVSAIMVSVVSVLIGADILAALFYRHFAHRWLPPESARILIDTYRLLVTLTGLVLAFSLFQVQTNFREVSNIVVQEANTLDLVARELQQIGSADALALRERLTAYGDAIVTQEWPLLARGRHSPRVGGMYAELLRSAGALEPAGAGQQTVYNDLIRNIDLLGSLRDQRLAAAGVRLPGVFWLTIWAMTAACIVLAASVPATFADRLATLLPAAALGVLIALVIIIDVPFAGEFSVHPTEMQHIVDDLKSSNIAPGISFGVGSQLAPMGTPPRR
jgi:hypothetical protein